MRDLPLHLLLFAVVGFAIVGLNAAFAEPVDAPALRSLPRRLLWFFAGCGVLAAILLFVEWAFARVS